MPLVGSQRIHELLPDPEVVLGLEPEELAGPLLQFLNSFPQGQPVNQQNFGQRHTVEGYPHEYQEQVQLALMEAWAWLEREGFVVPRPQQVGGPGWFVISRRGRRMKTATDVEAYRKADLL